MEETVGRAREEFETAAARVSDRQLVRLMEATRMETREASSQLEARAAEARAMIQSAAHSILDEFRRQAEVQIELAISEATQRLSPRWRRWRRKTGLLAKRVAGPWRIRSGNNRPGNCGPQ